MPIQGAWNNLLDSLTKQVHMAQQKQQNRCIFCFEGLTQ